MHFHRASIALLAILLVVTLATAAGIAAGAPYRPASIWFPLQSLFERGQLRLQSTAETRAEYALGIAERRGADVVWALKGKYFDLTLAHASAALDQALVAVASAPEGRPAGSGARLLVLADTLRSAVYRAAPGDGAAEGLLAKLDAVTAIARAGDAKQSRLALAAGIPVQFRDENLQAVAAAGVSGYAATHRSFPLTGAHATTDCTACHVTKAVATADIAWQAPAMGKQCRDCHAADRSAGHMPAGVECAGCHVPSGWQAVRFEHARSQTPACIQCHAAKLPAYHSDQECGTCHTTITWQQPAFRHSQVDREACAVCHASALPPGHGGNSDCSECHSAAAGWSVARAGAGSMFATGQSAAAPRSQPDGTTPPTVGTSHPSGKDLKCATCHAARRPATHFPGDCSQCHSQPGVTWKGASFDHASAAAFDCASCHAAKRPANHYNGQCSTCHQTSGWLPANFNHGVAGGDCQSCHAAQRPANHLLGQCSECHKAGTAWIPSTANHFFPMDHRSANRVCTTCHPAQNRGWTCWNCHRQGETEKHHLEKGISNLPALCMNCHPDGRKHDD